mgnify:CR=1 FL=1
MDLFESIRPELTLTIASVAILTPASVGDVVTVNLPKKADADQESGEKQMNDKVLIVRLRHRIKMTGASPQYTMLVEAVKAAFKESGS